MQTTPSSGTASTTSHLDFEFLEPGAQTVLDIANRLCQFLDGARQTLDIAIYDFRLVPAAAASITAAVDGAKHRGVAIRLLFNEEPRAKPEPIAHVPPSEVDWDLVHRLGVPIHPISGVPDLMHHKYVIRDREAVWTGSANWTTDAWTLEENLIVRVTSGALAEEYTRNFEELWTDRSVARSGHFTPAWVADAGLRMRPLFAPGRGRKLAHEIAQRIASARRRVRIASPVITSGPILGTVCEVLADGRVDVAGVYDRTQMAEALSQWGESGVATWKSHAFEQLVASGRFTSKVSTPWQKGGPHDFMHAKVTVCDDTVFVGSFNLSHSGEDNAENVLEIVDSASADLCAAFIERVAARYSVAR
jgi:phosphatidylserine/phosphatidylglycerophosphate/cardiolipin synthase-like enzyme